MDGRFHCFVQVFLIQREGEEGDAVYGNLGVVGGWFKVRQGVRIQFKGGGKVFGEWGKVS